MGLYKYDNNSYDIYEKEAKLNIQTENLVIPKGSSHVFRIDTEVGYTNAGLYKLSIIDGLDEEVDSYNFNNRVIMVIKEIYIDSNGAEHTVHKLINLGGYVKEKGKPVDIKHLTPMYCGQLSSIGGGIYNYSDYDITIKNFSFFKDMQYSSAFVSGDFTEVPKQQVNRDEPEDSGDGTSEVVFESTVASLSKAGDKEFWFTTSEWFVTINRDDGRLSRWVAFDDKGNYLGNFDKGSIKLPDYTEYLIFYFDDSITDITERAPDRIIYMNNTGRKYGGYSSTYHYTFNDELNVQYDGFELNHIPNTNGNEKYDNGTGVLTFQLMIDNDDGSLNSTRYLYFSTQPFYYMYALSRAIAKPYIIDGKVVWFMPSLSLGNTVEGENVVTTSVRHIEHIKVADYDKCTDSWGALKADSYEYIFGNAIKQLTYKDIALEVKYPDGNLNN